MNALRILLAGVSLSGAASGQAVIYDAGVAGTPPVAPSPAEQGWQEHVSGAVTVAAVSPDPAWGLNAWQVNDGGAGFATYETDSWLVVHEPFLVTLDLRMLAGTFRLIIDTGDTLTDSYYEIDLELVGQDVLVHRPFHPPLVCASAGNGEYHRFELSGYLYVLDLYYDGQLVGQVDESLWGSIVMGWGCSFGSPDVGAGRFRVHHASIRTHDYGVLGNAYCSAVPNSTGFPARIHAEGVSQWNVNSLRLSATDLPPGEFGYFLASRSSGFVSNPGGSSGNLCLADPIARFRSQVANSYSAGFLWIDVDLSSIPMSPPIGVAPGDTWHFQAWFRDHDPLPTSNFTGGVLIGY